MPSACLGARAQSALAILRIKQRERLTGWKLTAKIQILQRKQTESRIRFWDRVKGTVSDSWIPQGCWGNSGVISCMFKKQNQKRSRLAAYFTARQHDQTPCCWGEWALQRKVLPKQKLFFNLSTGGEGKRLSLKLITESELALFPSPSLVL